MERLYFLKLQIVDGPLTNGSAANFNADYPDVVLSIRDGQEIVRCSRFGISSGMAAHQLMREIRSYAPDAEMVSLVERAPSVAAVYG